jgi:putative membrane protein
VIVGVPKTWWRMLLTVRGSSLQHTWKRLLATTLLAVAVTVLWEHYDLDRISLTTTPFSLIGLALGIFLGFRNNTSYDRFWEGRKLWGRLVNTSRSLTRQLLLWITPPEGESAATAIHEEQRRLVHAVIAYVHALRLHLREEPGVEVLGPLLGVDLATRLEGSTNRPYAVAQHLGEGVRGAWRAGWIHPQHVPLLEASLTDLTDIQGGCERIKSTPIPFTYSVLLHRIVGVYCAALPFGLVGTTGVWTPEVVALIAYAFFALDAIGEEIEEPFGRDVNDLPLGALSTTIERNLRERLGEPIPPAAEAVGDVLD